MHADLKHLRRYTISIFFKARKWSGRYNGFLCPFNTQRWRFNGSLTFHNRSKHTHTSHESRNLFLNANYFLDSIIIFLLDEMRFQLTHRSSIISKLPFWWQRAFIHVLQIYLGKFRLSGYMNNKPKMAIYFMTLMMRMCYSLRQGLWYL